MINLLQKVKNLLQKSIEECPDCGNKWVFFKKKKHKWYLECQQCHYQSTQKLFMSNAIHAWNVEHKPQKKYLCSTCGRIANMNHLKVCGEWVFNITCYCGKHTGYYLLSEGAEREWEYMSRPQL